MTIESEQTLRTRARIHQELSAQVEEAKTRAGSQVDINEILSEAISTAARSMVQTLNADRSQMLNDHARVWADVERIIRETWGEALDQFYAVVVCSEELCRIWNYANIADASSQKDAMFGAMSSISARALRCALEVHVLLSRGFPGGAAARARSVHELAVVARVLSTYGPGTDLARRYLDHSSIDQYEWATKDRLSAPVTELGWTPEAMKDLSSKVSSLDAQYGAGFNQPYGWAESLFSGGRIGPMRLATLVNMEEGRPDYRIHSHDLHPTAWGGELNLEVGGQVSSWRLTGLAGPAIATLIPLAQIVADTLKKGRTGVVNYYDMLCIAPVFHLVQEAEEVLMDAEAAAAERIKCEPVHPEPPPARPSLDWQPMEQ
jgi:hypothetical protein